MKNPARFRYTSFMLLVVITYLTSCGRESSPEGRMSIKVEALQKEMIDSLRQQNQAILDSLSAIRADVNELKQKVNK